MRPAAFFVILAIFPFEKAICACHLTACSFCDTCPQRFDTRVHLYTPPSERAGGWLAQSAANDPTDDSRNSKLFHGEKTAPREHQTQLLTKLMTFLHRQTTRFGR